MCRTPRCTCRVIALEQDDTHQDANRDERDGMVRFMVGGLYELPFSGQAV